MPTEVSPTISDAVTQPNTEKLHDAPAVAMGNLYQAAAQATGAAIQDAVHAQQEAFMESQAAANQGVALIYAVDTAATAIAEAKINRDADSSKIMELHDKIHGEKP